LRSSDGRDYVRVLVVADVSATILWRRLSVSGVGWPYELSAPTGTRAIFGVNRLRKSEAEEVFEPW